MNSICARARARGDVEPGERLGQADALGDLLEPQSVRPVGKAGHGDLGGPRLGERDRRQVVDVQAVLVGRIVELEHHAFAVERGLEIDPRPFVAVRRRPGGKRRRYPLGHHPPADADRQRLHFGSDRPVVAVDCHGLGVGYADGRGHEDRGGEERAQHGFADIAQRARAKPRSLRTCEKSL